MNTKQLTIKSEQEMQSFAENLAKTLKPPVVLALVGNLGAGKTTFTKYLAQALGIKENINSPTFTIINSYLIPNTKYLILYHIDCYRLHNPKELLDLGLSDILQNKSAFTVIEWADRVKGLLPKETVWLEFKHKGQNTREIEVPSI